MLAASREQEQRRMSTVWGRRCGEGAANDVDGPGRRTLKRVDKRNLRCEHRTLAAMDNGEWRAAQESRTGALTLTVQQ
jgi:hypothetical protein